MATIAPIDYSIDVQTPFQAALKGYQAGAAIRDDQAKQLQQVQEREQVAAQQQQTQRVLQGLISNPNPSASDYAAATMLVPGMKDQFKQAWELRSSEQQQNDLQHVGQVYSAIVAGQPKIAADLLRRRAEGMRNSGDESGARNAETMAGVIDEHPEFARTMIGMKLAALPGGDKMITNVAALNTDRRAEDKAPAELASANADATIKGAQAKYAEPRAQADAAKAAADATTAEATAKYAEPKAAAEAATAAVTAEFARPTAEATLKRTVAEAEKAGIDAKYAEQNAIWDIQKKGWDIKKIQADIDIQKEANRIAVMNAATARASNDLKRQELELKVAEARQALDDKIRAKVADSESGAANIDNMLNTIERVKKNDSLDSILGVVAGRLPGMTGEAADAQALIETLQSQAFLAQVPQMKSLGALSNAEGEKLTSALQSLNRRQTPKQFRENLDEAARLIKKGRDTLSQRTGVPLNKPDTPAAPGARPPLSSFGQ